MENYSGQNSAAAALSRSAFCSKDLRQILRGLYERHSVVRLSSPRADFNHGERFSA
jgi:hypothetical protein